MKSAVIKNRDKNLRYISKHKRATIMPEVQLLTKNRLIPVMRKLSNKGNVHRDCNKKRPKIIHIEKNRNKPATLLLRVIPGVQVGHANPLTQVNVNRNETVGEYCIHEKKSTLSRKTCSPHVAPLSNQIGNREESSKDQINVEESSSNYLIDIPLQESEKLENLNEDVYASSKRPISNESFILSSKSVLYNDNPLEFPRLFNSYNRTLMTETKGPCFLEFMTENLWKLWHTPIVKERMESKGFFPHRQRCNKYSHKLSETRSCPDYGRLQSSARIVPLRNSFNEKRRVTIFNRDSDPLSRKVEGLGSNFPSLMEGTDLSVLYEPRFKIQDTFNKDIRTLNTIGNRNVDNGEIEIARKYENNNAIDLSRLRNRYVGSNEENNVEYSEISNQCKIKYSWQVVGSNTQTSSCSLRGENAVDREDESTYPCGVKYSWQIIGASTQVCLENFDDSNYWSGVLLVPRKTLKNNDELNAKMECKKKSGSRQKNVLILNNQRTQTIVNEETQVNLDSPRPKYSWQNIIETARLVTD